MELAGFVPYYLLKMRHSQARNAFVWAFTLRLCQGSEEVPAKLKQVCLYGGTTCLLRHGPIVLHRGSSSEPHTKPYGRQLVATK